MTAQDVILYAKNSELADLAIKAEHDNTLIGYINLALIELYKRFPLSIQVEVVNTYPITRIYQLRNTNITKVLHVYDSYGKELTLPTVVGDDTYDIKEIAYNTFIVMNPKEEQLAFVYQATATMITLVTDEVVIPDVLLEALLHYIGYRAHLTLNGLTQGENNTHYMRFEKSCKTLRDLGHISNDELKAIDIEQKGWI